MGFIDSQRHQSACSGMVFEQLAGGFALQPLWRHVKQAERFITQLLQSLEPLSGSSPRAEPANATALQLQNLVLHQSD